MSRQFGMARYKPAGEWVQTTMVVPVAGVQHRQSSVAAFLSAVRKADGGNLRYGVRLAPEPNNPHDSNAIAVFGYAEVKGWFRTGRKDWHVGYLDRETALEVNCDLVARGIPIAGELYKIYVGDSGFVDIKVIVLAPPGNGLKKRLSS